MASRQRLAPLHQHCGKKDVRGTGRIPREDLSNILTSVTSLTTDRVDKVLSASGYAKGNDVVYADFLEWLLPGDSKLPGDSRVSTPKKLSRAPTGTSLSPIKLAPPTNNVALAGKLPPIKTAPVIDKAALPGIRPASRLGSKVNTSCLGFREQAAQVVERTGRPGELVDDLVEADIMALQYPASMACWRSCPGLRVWRSKTVTQALRLICSAPVPGLGGVSYLEVFENLTRAGWEHYMFLFGGLVRDIIRRKVGNDIDITYSAPASELARICKELGYKYTLDGDYILIGDAKGEEYLEGMVITHNGVTAPENSDFSMNWVFYDFVNDVIIDKTGRSVQAVIDNRCEIPCARDKWDRWVAIGGSRVLFRYFKFLVRGHEYDDEEMGYIAEKLLNFWTQNPHETVEIGRDTLSALINAKDSRKMERLRQLISVAFAAAGTRQVRSVARVGGGEGGGTFRRQVSAGGDGSRSSRTGIAESFLTAGHWWRKGWMPLLGLS